MIARVGEGGATFHIRVNITLDYIKKTIKKILENKHGRNRLNACKKKSSECVDSCFLRSNSRGLARRGVGQFFTYEFIGQTIFFYNSIWSSKLKLK